MKKEDRKKLVELAQYIWDECDGDLNLKLQIRGDLRTPEKTLLLDCLDDKGVLSIHGSTISISNNTRLFINNGGYTEEELKENKENLRKNLTLWFAGSAILISIGSLIVSIIALNK